MVFYIVILIWNLVIFGLYAADKSRARRKKRRISERTLIACALLGGGIGAFIGMQALRHKTRHTNFRILVPLGLLITLAIIAGYWFFLDNLEVIGKGL